MKFNTGAFTLAATLALSAALPGAAVAQQRGTIAQQAENTQAASDLHTRMDMTEERITEGLRDGKISPARAVSMRRQVTQTRTSMNRLSRQQGFVSAAELASYNRTLGALDIELDRRGVARSYGNDGLVATGDAGRNDGFQYDCRDERIAIAILGDQLDHALAQLRSATRCPISGTDLAVGKRSRPVVGTMTPAAALQAMLSGTGLEGNAIKGGFQVTRLPR